MQFRGRRGRRRVRRRDFVPADGGWPHAALQFMQQFHRLAAQLVQQRRGGEGRAIDLERKTGEFVRGSTEASELLAQRFYRQSAVLRRAENGGGGYGDACVR